MKSTVCGALLAAMVAAGCLAQEPATPSFGTTVVVPGGLRGDIYFLPNDTMTLPDFDGIESAGAIWTSELNVPPRHWTEGFPGVTDRFEWFAINYTGRFWIEQPGRYSFALLSDDGSKLYIDDNLIIDNDCQHPPDTRKATVTLAGGLHRIRVPYFQGPRDCLALMLAVAGPDGNWRLFNTEEFKPPADPEKWKYGNPAELAVPPDQGAVRAKMAAEMGKPQKKKHSVGLAWPRKTEQSAEGCVAYPTRNCGYTPMPDLHAPAAPQAQPTPAP
jgi:hypothetical protein